MHADRQQRGGFSGIVFRMAFSYMEQSIDILELLQSPDLDIVLEIYEDIKFIQTQDMFEYMLYQGAFAFSDNKLKNEKMLLVT